MALKDWKMVSSRTGLLYDIEWIKKDGKKKLEITNNEPTLVKHNDINQYKLLVWGKVEKDMYGMGIIGRNIIKRAEFKNKTQALKYAKAYMRKY